MNQTREGPLLPFVTQDRRRIFLRITGMDDDRQPGLARNADVKAEQIPLHSTVRMIVIIVETGFADTDHAGIFRRREQGRLVQISMRVCFMRMNTDAGEYIAFTLRRADHLLPLAAAG